MHLAIRSLLLCLFIGTLTSTSLAARPNILIITIDDMSCDSVGAFGCTLPETTPNMDALARSSLRFRYAHVLVGNCMPSRNVMWSGRYPHNNGVEGFYQVQQPTYPVLCDLAQQAGYFTAIRHKVSHSTPYSPYAWDLVLDSASDGTALHVKDASSYGECTTRGIGAAAQADKPFCLVINVADPHKPFYTEVKQGVDPHVPSKIFTADEVPVPGFLPDDRVIREELARYYSSVRRADDGVGSILAALDASGHTDDTLVMFLADHGMPLPFAKTQLYHHSTRTPLMIRWPGVTQAGGEDSRHLVSAVDFLPTLLNVIEAPLPEGLDGRSFVPLLRGRPQSDRDYVIKEYNENSGGRRNPMRAIQTRQYLYIFNPWSDGELKMATATNGTDTYRRMQALAITDSEVAKRLAVADFRTLEELYDVESDPDCLTNLVNEPKFREVCQLLRGQLLTHMRITHDPVAAVFEQRHDAQAVGTFMREVQHTADERRAASRRNAGNKAKAPAKKLEVITLGPTSVFREAGKLSVEIGYQLPARLAEQKLFVTLKSADNKRIERKMVSISGQGKTTFEFTLSEAQSSGRLQVAAFVGENFQSSLQHLQVGLD